MVRSLVLAPTYCCKADGKLPSELSRLTLSVEHFLLDRIESDFFRCLPFQTHLIGVDIFFISASVSLVRTGYILARRVKVRKKSGNGTSERNGMSSQSPQLIRNN